MHVLIHAVDGLAGVTQTFSGSNSRAAPNEDPTCALLSAAANAVAEARSAAMRQVLNDLRETSAQKNYPRAVRYFWEDVSDTYSPHDWNVTAVLNESVAARMSPPSSRLNVRWTDSASESLSYQRARSNINMDVRALRTMVLAPTQDHYTLGFNLYKCWMPIAEEPPIGYQGFEGSVADADPDLVLSDFDRTFCWNVGVRFEMALRQRGWGLSDLFENEMLGGYMEFNDPYNYANKPLQLRAVFGETYTAAFLDEAWAYFNARAEVAASLLHGCIEATSGRIEPATPERCTSDAGLEVSISSIDQIERLIVMAIGHELGHWMLGHSSDQVAALQARLGTVCNAGVTLESQADAFGARLLRLYDYDRGALGASAFTGELDSAEIRPFSDDPGIAFDGNDPNIDAFFLGYLRTLHARDVLSSYWPELNAPDGASTPERREECNYYPSEFRAFQLGLFYDGVYRRDAGGVG